MISAKEAIDIVLSNTTNWGNEEVSIEFCIGRVLQEDIVADRDFPPFDRVTMDGIAIKFEDFESGIREFEITDMQTAGEGQKVLIGKGIGHEIMTGAILSANANVVVRYEDLNISLKGEKKYAEVNFQGLTPWKNVHRQGTDRKSGDCLIERGRMLSASDVAVLATVGKEKVLVSRLPKVAIISTGDELVEVNRMPEGHQIRMSNSVMIQAKLNEMKIENKRFHLLDDYDDLLSKVGEILNNFDVLLISGGVSKGKADYIPEVLNQLGVEKLFHRVAQRPGKPFWFGKKEENRFVFALPGNPISTFMCFTVYFLPWLQKSIQVSSQKQLYAVLDEDFNFEPELTYFLQVNCQVSESGVLIASPREGGGSGDLSNLVKSNGFLELLPDRNLYRKGERFKVCMFQNF
ncbi:molybdopterin molybdotransferase MoeA [Reichenbachiella sp. MALMAid0571]|uniref:molybdopterin molybdotransferase MoeA n=1 Tax=Reichenbachiella sp. MALMAid0571 TaxID=3143939 RepID=UPI0032E00BEC